MAKTNISHTKAVVEVARLRKKHTTRALLKRVVTGHAQFTHGRARHAAAYITGLLCPVTRGKGSQSVTGIAARLDENSDALHHFVADAPWDAQTLSLEVVREALRAAAERGIRPLAYTMDDTTEPKAGHESPGVARQYSGRHGAVIACQSFPNLQIVLSNGRSIPVSTDVYLPAAQWDSERAEAAGVPARLVGKSKAEVGLALIDAALAAGLPRLPVLADQGFGDSGAFRLALEQRGLGFLVDIGGDTSFYDAFAPASPRRGASPVNRVGKQQSAEEWLINEPSEEWPACSGAGCVVKHQVLRPSGKTIRHLHVTAPELLTVIGYEVAWADEQRYAATNLDVREAMALLGRRWACEAGFRELKQLTGFTAYQGRSYAGLARHLALAMVAHALLLIASIVTVGTGDSRGITLYEAARRARASLLLAWHESCPLCLASLPPPEQWS